MIISPTIIPVKWSHETIYHFPAPLPLSPWWSADPGPGPAPCLGPVLVSVPIPVPVAVQLQLRFRLGQGIVSGSVWTALTLPGPASVLVPARLRRRERVARMRGTFIFLRVFKVSERREEHRRHRQ